MRGSLAQTLALRTMMKAYREWHLDDGNISNKARLYRILAREFLGIGKGKTHKYQPGQFLSETNGTSANIGNVNPREVTSATEFRRLLLSDGSSDVSVKAAVVRLRPQSRLMMTLLLRERFSDTEIAYIMDLSRNSVRAILARLQAVILRSVLESNVPIMFPQEDPADSTSDT
jgi:DNA-directed RNA polymerase specialized sigma24 family protein